MAFKQFALDEHTLVTIYKRRSSRSLRLSIAPTGEVRVSIPVWAPYAAGLQFAKARHDWITQHVSQRPGTMLVDGQPIGKAHHLRMITSSSAQRTTSRVMATDITITRPVSLEATEKSVQRVAETASVRALRQQAEQLLPQRLTQLSKKHDLPYRTVSIKRLKSRWGSCDQRRNIVLNLFLMQLPWDCIDYVLLHELVHTQVLRHGPDFWQRMSQELPETQALRKQMRDYQPVLHGSLAPPMA